MIFPEIWLMLLPKKDCKSRWISSEWGGGELFPEVHPQSYRVVILKTMA